MLRITAGNPRRDEGGRYRSTMCDVCVRQGEKLDRGDFFKCLECVGSSLKVTWSVCCFWCLGFFYMYEDK